ncbi:Nmad2 family putative nucleotide modification protein [Halorubrum distributum]|uniref:Nmad2 family putative nucleotide modification protein n=1 Tax=Halorubrum distributum TaxID=29283 RepID=UPI000A5A4173|nr:hypothetical protein [Halorubrum terrestre]
MSGYLIRVGLDTGSIGGGGHAPIAEDGAFDYIPIPEDADSEETTTYANLESQLNIDASDYTERDEDTPLHRDPEFETYTYGEVGTNKRRSLRKLSDGDLLVFYSSLQPQDGHDHTRLYIIGYFTVDAVHDLEEVTPEERAEVLNTYPNNAHVKRHGLSPDERTSGRENYPVIVSGDPDRSELLERAIPLTSPTISKASQWYKKYRPLSTPNDLLGLNATDLTRSMPKKIRGDPDQIRAWLAGDFTQEVQSRAATPDHYRRDNEQNSSSLSSETSRLRGYVIATDSGFAPHVRDGLLSLATCAPQVRSKMEPGDWVFAVGNNQYETDKELVYAFRVEKTIQMDDYYTSARFHSRKPLAENNNPAGDNIYAPRSEVEDIEVVNGGDLPDSSGANTGARNERGMVDTELCYSHHGGDYFQLHSSYHDLGNYETDLEKQGDREKVLISSDFYYFGSDPITVPASVADEVVPGFGGHDGRNSGRITEGSDEVTMFVEWLRSKHRVGIHAEPKHGNSEVELEDTTGPGC